MAQRLKRWESPRREGRNHKGKGGSARQRQRRKQLQVLRQKLKEQGEQSGNKTDKNSGGGKIVSPFIFSPQVGQPVSGWFGSADFDFRKPLVQLKHRYIKQQDLRFLK